MPIPPPPCFEQLQVLVSAILDASRPAWSLRCEVAEMAKILADLEKARIARHADIAGGETRTSDGLALSPAMAAMCADDYVRTIAFLRGTHAAILDIRARYPDRPARVLYAGCGPYATLAIPLMAILSSAEASFGLLDLHAESIESVRSIVDALELAGFVTECEAMDAATYRVRPDRTPDVILLEAMQACLESEPQVAITRHLVAQAPDAILIPEEVRIDLVLVDASREFCPDGGALNRSDEQRDRIRVGSVFVLSRQTVNLWQNIGGSQLPGSGARLPDSMAQRYQPMLFTSLRVYRNHVLKEYDSGLTYPRIFSGKTAIKAGDVVEFHYELGQRPHLEGEVRSLEPGADP